MDNGDLAWNSLFSSILDVSRVTCQKRRGNGNEVAAQVDWSRQMMAGLTTEEEKLEFEKFSLDLARDILVKRRAKDMAEDEEFEADALLEISRAWKEIHSCPRYY